MLETFLLKTHFGGESGPEIDFTLDIGYNNTQPPVIHAHASASVKPQVNIPLNDKLRNKAVSIPHWSNISAIRISKKTKPRNLSFPSAPVPCPYPQLFSTYAASAQPPCPQRQTSVVESQRAPASSPKPFPCTFEEFQKKIVFQSGQRFNDSTHSVSYARTRTRIRSSYKNELSTQDTTLEISVVKSVKSRWQFLSIIPVNKYQKSPHFVSLSIFTPYLPFFPFSSTCAASAQPPCPQQQTSVVASPRAPASSPKPSPCTFQA